MSLLVLLGCYDPDARDVRTLDQHDTETTTPGDTDTDTDTGTHGGHDSGGTETGDTSGDTSTETGETSEPGPVEIAIDLVSPSSGSTRGGDAVVLYGGPFDASTVASFGGDAAVTTSTTQTTLSVITPAHAVAGAVDVIVESEDGRGEAPGAFTYVVPCEGGAATPSSVHFSASGSTTIRLEGCATGIIAIDDTFTGSNGTTCGVVWSAVPSSVDGSSTVTLTYTADPRTVSASFGPQLTTDQGNVTVSVSVP